MKIITHFQSPVFRLRLGIGLFVMSFVVGYPVAAFLGIELGPSAAFWCYAISWAPFLLGIGIGGEPALEATKSIRRRVLKKFIPRRRNKGGPEPGCEGRAAKEISRPD